MGKKVKERQPQSYVDVHNRAVIRFRKSAKVLLWAAIFNVLALAIGIIQINMGSEGGVALPTYFCFGVIEFLFYFIWTKTAIEFGGMFAILICSALVLSGGVAYLAITASQGKKIHLFMGTGIYFVDWILTLLSYFLFPEAASTIWLSAGFHAIISACSAIAIYQYFNVINIEKRFVKKEHVQKIQNAPIEERD